MNASRTHFSRMIQYDAANLIFDGSAALQKQIIALLERRANPMTLKQIQMWFNGTDKVFVQTTLDVLVESGAITIGRTALRTRGAKRAYVYEVAR